MPKLIIKDKQKTIQEVELTGEKLLIGRSENNDIKLENDLVSREHCEIRKEGNKYYLSDLGSANGTYVNNRPISRDYELKAGDIIKVGPYTIGFVLEEQEKPTRVIGISTTERIEKPTEIFTYSGTPRILVRSGTAVGKSYDLSSNPLVGRDPECDIQLSELTVSRKHARFQFVDNKLSVVDVGSRSGTRVNGKLVDKPTLLKDGDKVQLGEVILEVDWKGAPKIETERPTVPYFRPEIITEKKSEWWKWAVGIAAAIIVIVGILWILRIFPQPVERLSEDLVHQATQRIQKGEYKQALTLLDLHLSKFPNDENALKLKTETHTTLVVASRIKAESLAAINKREKAIELANEALENTKALIQLNMNNAWAILQQDELTKLIHKLSMSSVTKTKEKEPSKSEKSTYEIAVDSYYDGRLEEARNLFRTISISNKNYTGAQQYLKWISKWEEAKYLLNVRKDFANARQKYNELLSEDPNNQKARDELATIPSWNSEKASLLYEEAHKKYQEIIDYGDPDGKLSQIVIQNCQEIVKMGPPPSEYQEIYNGANKMIQALSPK